MGYVEGNCTEDSSLMFYRQDIASCCGVDELHEVFQLKTEDECKAAIKNYYKENCPGTQAVFTDVVEEPNGECRRKVGGSLLAATIKKLKLGRIVSLPARLNLNHDAGNRGKDKTWLWLPPRKLTKPLKDLGVTTVLANGESTEYNDW